MKKDKFYWLRVSLYAMFAILAVLLFWVFGLDEYKRMFFSLVAVLAFIFMGLGIVLIVLAYKKRLKGKLKWVLVVAGGSAVGIPLLSILHNVLYALSILSEGILVLKILLDALEAASFLIALLVCPIAFLICSVWALVIMKKKLKVKGKF